jgi:hypothetical protein
LYHISYGFFLAFHTFMFRIRRLRLHLKPCVTKRTSLLHIRVYPKILGFLTRLACFKNKKCPLEKWAKLTFNSAD